MTYKNVFAKEIWIDKMPLIKKENKDARVTKNNLWCEKTKRTTWKHAARNKRNEKNSEAKKEQTQKMPTAVLRGDSQSGLAANAPIRSALSWPFYLSWSEFVLAGAWPRSAAARL